MAVMATRGRGIVADRIHVLKNSQPKGEQEMIGNIHVYMSKDNRRSTRDLCLVKVRSRPVGDRLVTVEDLVSGYTASLKGVQPELPPASVASVVVSNAGGRIKKGTGQKDGEQDEENFCGREQFSISLLTAGICLVWFSG